MCIRDRYLRSRRTRPRERLRRWWRKGGWARGTRSARRAPDTGPEFVRHMRWIVCAGEGLAQSDAGPEPGAQCGSSARWDLCGGPPERAVPTASLLEEVWGPAGQRDKRPLTGPFSTAVEAFAAVERLK